MPLECAASLPVLERARLEREEPDAHVMVVENDAVQARCSLWYTNAPKVENQMAAAVGHFAAVDKDCAARVLEAAEERVVSFGGDFLVGPMDGNTWRSYRFMTKTAPGVERFFLEPWNPPEWPLWFEQLGWDKLANYSSSRIDLGASEKPERTRLAQRLDSAGIKIRTLDRERYREELVAIYEVCAVCFANNFLYTPLSESEFLTMYGQVENLAVPEFVRIAEVDGSAIGFVFAIPDAGEMKVTGKAETLIVKTLAVLPERRFAGLGTLLVDLVQSAAADAGFRWAIHALQYESNTSLRITNRHGAEPIRQYTLYSKNL